MPIRLIAVDLDKTLLHSDKTLSAFSAQTLCSCRNAGVARWLRRTLSHLFTTL